MKKVFINAYTNFNLGDDLFIKVICERYPGIKFVLMAPSEYKITMKNIKNLIVIPKDSVFVRGINYFFRKFFKTKDFIKKQISNKCDIGVLIGGSLFIQHDDWEANFLINQNMKIKNKPFFLLGANFGPFEDLNFHLKYKQLFKGYTDICFRERYSFDQFKDLDNVRIADDIIFQLTTKKVDECENNIVISVIKPSKKNLAIEDRLYIEKIRDLSIYLIKEGYNIILMSFCEPEGDKEVVDEITNQIPEIYKGKISSHFYKKNIEETLHLISTSSFVIATRFHAMVLGWVFKKPVFPIAYSEKMVNVINDIGFKNSYIHLNQINELNPTTVMSSLKNIIDITKHEKNAQEHFLILDKFLLEDDVLAERELNYEN